ncbi:hypothetical protein [Chryseobacterium contaminans]|uniref:hypothetical protein n=1 Tax=Chryseobacterium contaminans TaxID=1423959 RepID=UPI00301B2582
MNCKKYYNEFFKEITEQEADQLDELYIKYFVEGRIKKKDHISPDYFMGEYYLDAIENLQQDTGVMHIRWAQMGFLYSGSYCIWLCFTKLGRY